MPSGLFEYSLGLCGFGYDRGPPRAFRLGLLSAVYRPGTYRANVAKDVDAGMQQREAQMGVLLAAAKRSLLDLSRQFPGAANAAGQRDSAPGGIVPSRATLLESKLDAAPGGVPHFGNDG